MGVWITGYSLGNLPIPSFPEFPFKVHKTGMGGNGNAQSHYKILRNFGYTDGGNIGEQKHKSFKTFGHTGISPSWASGLVWSPAQTESRWWLDLDWCRHVSNSHGQKINSLLHTRAVEGGRNKENADTTVYTHTSRKISKAASAWSFCKGLRDNSDGV